jgi:hypothetical protein
MRYPIVLHIFLMGILLVSMLFAIPFVHSARSSELLILKQGETAQVESTYVSDSQAGILDPVLIEHSAASAGPTTYSSVRTDVTPTPSSELFMPAGPAGNMRSADCTGGYFRVGPGGTTSFATAAGTISLWLKFDSVGPNGRFWGQDDNFETRWQSNRLVLDWGSATALQGTKSDWLADHWYFIAVTWDQDANTLVIYWGDEDNHPIVDASTSWSGVVVGRLFENDIMNSKRSTNPSDHVDGHIDDFRYYSVQRTLDELRSDYKLSLTGSEVGLVHYYGFEDSLDDSAGSSTLVSSGSYTYSKDVFSGNDGWKAEHIEVNVRNIEQLFALRGSFESGVPGTDTDWITDNASCYPNGWRARRLSLNQQDSQRVSYNISTPAYVVLENEGYDNGSAYLHYNGTTIYWYQIINNSLMNSQFEFSMKYLYQRGPIGENYRGVFEFGFQIMNGSSVVSNWSLDATNMTERGIWNEIDSVIVEIPKELTSFELRVFFSINANASYVGMPYGDPDLDADVNNGRYVTFWVDDVSLTAMQKPSPMHIDLQAHFTMFGDITIFGESGTGSILINCSYRDRSFMPFSFSSNTTISFEYLVRVSKMTRFYNSSYQKSLDNEGVLFEAELGENPKFLLYTYMKSYSDVGDLGFIVHYPHDWYGPDVQDPLGNNITFQLVVGPDSCEIPIGKANLVGWWQVQLRGPNYVSSISTQVLKDTGPSWANETIYRNGDRVRCIATLGHLAEAIGYVSNVEFNWYLPSGNLWWTDSISNWNSTNIITNGTTLGSSNATIGLWIVTLSWYNGTEVAFGHASFEVRHTLTVFAQTPTIEIEPNGAFTAAISVYDQDNGNPILSDASVIGNWSTQEILFSPNLAKGWWEADFNSSTIGTGDFVVLVIVSIPYYDVGNCSIDVSIPVAESLFIITVKATLLGALSVFAFFVVLTVARRFYASAATRRNLEIVALKGRIEDARTLIGVLVIHRSIGLPIYSRIIKGGFQESLLSSFITALSQFRAEFSWDEPKWTAIPITEVITAVQTEMLICAMITVESASLRQRGQLETFARDIGLQYDLENGKIRQMVNNRDLSESIDPVFFSHFDGALFERYVGVRDDLPKHLDLVRETLEGMEIDNGVTPEAIIKSMTLQGYSDRKSYNAVLEAIDSGYLILAEKSLPAEAGSRE